MPKPIVLNVDDNDAGRYAISRILTLAGFQVFEAATGSEALELAATKSPEMILLDVNLPDLNGLEVCRRIKADPNTAAVPILMMSATLIGDQDRVRGLEGGADAYLTGPLDPDVLIATMNALLRARVAEDALQDSARLWLTTFNAINDGVALLDAGGIIRQCNTALERLTGKSAAEIVGSNCAAVFGIESGMVPCAMVPLPRHRAEVDVPVGTRWMCLTSDPVFAENGEFNGAVCIASDVTGRKLHEQELKQAKEAAESADRAKDQFLAVLSHELRTPLTPVLTAVQAVQEENLPPEINSYLDVIKRNVELEARLIDDLLDLTRIARNKLQLNLEIVDAHSLMGNTLSICQSDIDAKRLTLTLDLTAPRHHVRADTARLQQVFWNLIKNAVKFTHEGGTLTIKSENSASNELCFGIVDTGIGIEAHILPRIFNAFEQGEQSINRQFGGLGLGLAISKALVDMLGGTLTASSVGKDQGATFTIGLPVAEPGTANGTVAEESMNNESKGNARRILIVDDHADTSRVMQLLLERRGYVVGTAHTMQTALEQARTGEYDLLISDIGLPDGSGLELMRELTKTVRLPGVALSGFGMEEDIQNSIDAGFSEHLTKPISFKRLHEVILQMLGE